MTDLLDSLHRRKFIGLTGAFVAGTTIAGCIDDDDDDVDEPVDDTDDEIDDEPVDDEPDDEIDDEPVDDTDDEEPDDEEPVDGEYVDEEPDYEGWFDDVPNYEGTLDLRGEEEVTVDVGAGEDGLLFEPPAIMIDVGTTVVWEWTGEGGQHNVVETEGEFESELVEDEGHTFDHVFEAAGTYLYLCEPHDAQGMRGAVVADDEEAPETDDGDA